MPQAMSFTRNFNDLSSESEGYFQFEFFCDRCQNGYRSQVKRSSTSTTVNIIDSVGGFLGGFIGRAANMGEKFLGSQWHTEHDTAWVEAMNEVKPHFHYCSRCAKYVCESCFNEQAGLCADDAPRLNEEMAAARTEYQVQQMREAMSNAKLFDGNISQRQTTCPTCGKPAGTEKFCGNCGGPLGMRKCPSCGTDNNPTVRFCGECGTKMG